MANFCSKCGVELSSDTRFCQGCGAPTGFAAAPAMSPGVPAAAQVPVAPAPAVTGPSSGTLKIVLIIVGAIVCIGMLGAVAVMFGIWRISKVGPCRPIRRRDHFNSGRKILDREDFRCPFNRVGSGCANLSRRHCRRRRF